MSETTQLPAVKPAKRVGRPSKYTLQLAERVLTQVRLGRSINQICKDNDMPARQTIAKWLQQHSDFLTAYDRAMEAGAHFLIADSHEIVDSVDPVIYREEGAIPNSAAVKKAELQSRFRQWLAGKWNSRYREKTELELGGKVEVELGVRLDAAQRRLVDIEAQDVVSQPSETAGQLLKSK